MDAEEQAGGGVHSPLWVQVDDYRILKECGFTPSQAAKIVIEAKAGDEHARWVVHRSRLEAKES
jgi:hypothetical protein